MAEKRMKHKSGFQSKIEKQDRIRWAMWGLIIVVSGIMLIETMSLFAQSNTETKDVQSNTATADRDTRSASRGRFGNWLDQMTQAYEENDREKMGKLIDQMKQRRQRWQGRNRSNADTTKSQRQDQASPTSVLTGKDAEKKILATLEDMHQNQRRGMMNVPPDDGRMLRLLTESIGAKRVVEIGTSNGYSGIWFCLALRHTGGQLITHEINAERANLARENFKRAGVQELVKLVQGDAHETIKNIKGSIDILFLDADKAGYPDYLEKLLPLVRPGGLVLAHNTSSHGNDAGMQNYVKIVSENPDLETLFIHRQAAGIGITLKKH